MIYPFPRKAREDLEARTQKLSEVMANFGDVVPSKDYERLDAQFKVAYFYCSFHFHRFLADLEASRDCSCYVRVFGVRILLIRSSIYLNSKLNKSRIQEIERENQMA